MGTNVVKALLSLGASPRVLSSMGLSSWLWAKHIGNERILRMLKESDPDFESETVVAQLQRLQSTGRVVANADILFLGSPPSFEPAPSTSGIGARMQDFI